jgi:hypothetical protein
LQLVPGITCPAARRSILNFRASFQEHTTTFCSWSLVYCALRPPGQYLTPEQFSRNTRQCFGAGPWSNLPCGQPWSILNFRFSFSDPPPWPPRFKVAMRIRRARRTNKNKKGSTLSLGVWGGARWTGYSGPESLKLSIDHGGLLYTHVCMSHTYSFSLWLFFDQGLHSCILARFCFQLRWLPSCPRWLRLRSLA